MGAFHLVKISGISGSVVNGTRFVGSSHWKILRKSGKSKKVGPFSRLEFPNGMSCSIYLSRSLYQFQVHGRASRRTGVYDQMEQLFTTFAPTEISVFFFPKWKAPDIYHFKSSVGIVIDDNISLDSVSFSVPEKRVEKFVYFFNCIRIYTRR